MTYADRVRDAFGRYQVDLVCQKAESDRIADYKKTLQIGGNLWTMRLITQMQPRRLGRGIWDVSMPKYGHYLDAMRPHFVALLRGRRIREWYREKVLQGAAPRKYPRAIFVRPHPFKAEGDANFPYNLNKHNIEEVNRIIASVI